MAQSHHGFFFFFHKLALNRISQPQRHRHTHHNAQGLQTTVELLSNRMGARRTSVIQENKGVGEPWRNKALGSRNHTNESGIRCWGTVSNPVACWASRAGKTPAKCQEKVARRPQSAQPGPDCMFCPLSTGTSPFTQFTQKWAGVNVTWINPRMLMHATLSKKGYFPRNLKRTDVQFAWTGFCRNIPPCINFSGWALTCWHQRRETCRLCQA